MRAPSGQVTAPAQVSGNGTVSPDGEVSGTVTMAAASRPHRVPRGRTRT